MAEFTNVCAKYIHLNQIMYQIKTLMTEARELQKTCTLIETQEGMSSSFNKQIQDKLRGELAKKSAECWQQAEMLLSSINIDSNIIDKFFSQSTLPNDTTLPNTSTPPNTSTHETTSNESTLNETCESFMGY